MSHPKIPERRGPDDFLVSCEADIKAPMATVFEVIEDLELFVELESNVKKVIITSEIKKGKGMKSRWLLENPETGASWELDEEIVYYKKPEQLAYVGSSPDGKDYAGAHTLGRNPDGSTHLFFAERFFFKGDPGAFRGVIDGMVANIKRISEERTGKL
jgi:hypothetical protein